MSYRNKILVGIVLALAIACIAWVSASEFPTPSLSNVGQAFIVADAGGTAAVTLGNPVGTAPASGDVVACDGGWCVESASGVDGGTIVTFPVGLSVGATPAQSGVIRLSNATSIAVRNGANSGDIYPINTDSSNNVYLGQSAQAVYVGVSAAGGIHLQFNATDLADTTANGIAIANTTAPSTPTASKVIVYSTSGNLAYLTASDAGVVLPTAVTSFADAGTAGALPATPQGFLTMQVNGNTIHVPYYN